MKQLFTLLFLAGFAISSRAQDIQPNKWLLGGTLGFTRQHSQTDTASDVRAMVVLVNPSIGKFYRKNRMAGINLFYSHNRFTGQSYTSNMYGAGAYLRQYLPVAKSFYVFAEEGVSAQTQKSDQIPSSSAVVTEQKQTTLDIYFYPGLAYGLTKHFQLELSLYRLVNLNYIKRSQQSSDRSQVTRTSEQDISAQLGTSGNAIGFLTLGAKLLL